MSDNTVFNSRNMTQIYEYQPLPSVEHMRLVRIDTGDFEDELTIEIMTVSSRAATSLGYNALSYVWGDERDPAILGVREFKSTRDVVCLEITQNLAVALQYLRQRDPYQLWWIDALCINQREDTEKSLQVGKMGEIFRNASRVVAWLGPPGVQGERGMIFINQLYSDLKPNFDIDYKGASLIPTSESFRYSSESLDALSAYQPCFTSTDALALLDIVERPWFRRLWIRQEAFLANPHTFVMRCGQSSMSWRKFRHVLASLAILGSTISHDGMFDRMHWGKLDMAVARSISLVFHHSISLCELRFSLQGSQCKDDRDRIFASLELLGGSARRLGIEPDYSKTVGELYLDVARRYIMYERDAEILKECFPQNHSSAVLSEAPTWVPRWSDVDHVYYLSRAVMRASADIIVPQIRPCVFDEPQMEQRGRLHIWGLAGPIVDVIGQPCLFENGQDATERYEALRAVLLRPAFINDLNAASPHSNQTVLEHYVDILTFGEDEIITSKAPRFKLPPNLCSIAMREVLSRQDPRDWNGMDQNTRELVEDFCDLAFKRIAGSCLALSFDGELLVVPEGVQKGDQICALLGCRSTMLLRPSPCSSEEGQYLVIGPCYSTHMSNGGAFLGRLPANVGRLFSYQGDECAWHDAITRKVVSMIDPRFELLLQKLPPHVADSLRENLRKGRGVEIDIDVLEEHRASIGAVGGKIRRFDLI